MRLICVTVADLATSAPAGLTKHVKWCQAPFPEPFPDIGLVVRARQGDREAFGALVELLHRAARRVALAATGNLADADEAVQDACLAAWRRLASLDDPASFRAWLLRITWRKALDRRRSVSAWLKRFRSVDEPEGAAWPLAGDPHNAADERLVVRERDRAVASVVRALPARLRDPFLLAVSGEHRYEDIAALLHVPVGTVKWRVFEARRIVRQKLERLGYGDSR
jgi:RNA polymerase sigma-70 factor (ECF subfamily)